MEYACTICCKRKRRDPQPLAARRRYLSRRISHVARSARRAGRPLLILSGKYGLLGPADRIPWYDHRLARTEVAGLAARVERQLRERGVTAVTLYARPRATPGWRHYYDVLEGACRRCAIPLEVATLGPEYL